MKKKAGLNDVSKRLKRYQLLDMSRATWVSVQVLAKSFCRVEITSNHVTLDWQRVSRSVGVVHKRNLSLPWTLSSHGCISRAHAENETSGSV